MVVAFEMVRDCGFPPVTTSKILSYAVRVRVNSEEWERTMFSYFNNWHFVVLQKGPLCGCGNLCSEQVED